MGFKQAGTFKQQLSVMGTAVKYCTEARLSGRLSEELKSADIIGQYGLFVHSMPWKRHPATLTAKEIYALLTVFC